MNKLLPLFACSILFLIPVAIQHVHAGGSPTVSPSGEPTVIFNGNCYAFIPSFGIPFDIAFTSAATKTVNGIPGHLATYSSLAEETASDGIGANAKGWIGYTRDGAFAPGPYAASGFGWIDGSPATYANWAGGEPNGDGPYTENNQAGSRWNDVPNHGFGNVQGYYVEFESCLAVGGEIIPIESTSLLLANTQSFSWMIPVLLSGIGIGLFVVSRKSEISS